MFLKTIKEIVNYLYGNKAFKVKKEDALEYEQVRDSLEAIVEKRCEKNGSSDFLRLEGEDAERIERDLPPQYRFYDFDQPCPKFILPNMAAMFFLKGGKWNEITNYECVKTYGLLHGKRRRLKIV